MRESISRFFKIVSLDICVVHGVLKSFVVELSPKAGTHLQTSTEIM